MAEFNYNSKDKIDKKIHIGKFFVSEEKKRERKGERKKEGRKNG